MNRLTIGEVADRTEVSVSTIRYYEKRGLIPEPDRFESSGYRAFAPETVRRIRFIRHAQSLGFTREEIKKLLSLRARCDTSCREVREVAEDKIAEIDDKIAKLENMRQGLASLAEVCPGDLTTECPILEVLEP